MKQNKILKKPVRINQTEKNSATQCELNCYSAPNGGIRSNPLSE